MPITPRRIGRSLAPWIAILAGAVLAAGCSSGSGSRADNAEDGGERPAVSKGAGQIQAQPEDSGEYPNLATVPDAPKAGMSPSQRVVIAEGLLADRENARYESGPPPKMLSQPGGQMPATPSTPVTSSDLPTTAAPAPTNPAPTSPASPAPGAPQTSGQDQQAAAPGSSTPEPSAQQTPAGEQVMLVAIRFPEGSAQPPAQTDQVLEQVVRIQKQEEAVLRIVGHTSAQEGDAEAKRALSNERAGVIASRLASFGAAKDDLLVEGVGDDEPAVTDAGGQDTRQNNRVEIYMIR